MDGKITPPTDGEWEVDTDFEPGDDITIQVGGAPIAFVYGTDSFPCLDRDEEDIDAINAENLATARLMAASKELLAACEASLDRWQKIYPLDQCGLRSLLRAAIAKATGATTP